MKIKINKTESVHKAIKILLDIRPVISTKAARSLRCQGSGVICRSGFI